MSYTWYHVHCRCLRCLNMWQMHGAHITWHYARCRCLRGRKTCGNSTKHVASGKNMWPVATWHYSVALQWHNAHYRCLRGRKTCGNYTKHVASGKNMWLVTTWHHIMYTVDVCATGLNMWPVHTYVTWLSGTMHTIDVCAGAKHVATLTIHVASGKNMWPVATWHHIMYTVDVCDI